MDTNDHESHIKSIKKHHIELKMHLTWNGFKSVFSNDQKKLQQVAAIKNTQRQCTNEK